MIEFTGATPVPIPMREANGFAFSAEETLSLITPETRLIILNSPANPTGGVTPSEEIDKLVAGLARFPDVAILSDEIYGQMTYDGSPTVAARLSRDPRPADPARRLVEDLCDDRLAARLFGVAASPRDVARKLAVNSYSCVNAAAQFAGLAALTGPQDAVARWAPNSTGRRNRRRGAQRAARRQRRDAEGRLLRLSQHRQDRLEGEGAGRRAARGGRRGDDRRARFRRPRRRLYPPLLRQFAGEHRARAGADAEFLGRPASVNARG